MIRTKKGFLFLLLFAAFHSIEIEAQNDASLIKKANTEFQKGNYASAINEYRQLLAKDPKSVDFNYKYATCLFHTDDINKATKYFDLILNMYDPPVASYFYRGKIYQNNYDFQKAIKCFEKYKSLLGKKDIDLGATIEINHCKNALSDIKSPGTFKTIKKYNANRKDFYQTYTFTSVNYSFFKVENVFEKQNSKRNFIPIRASYTKIKYRLFASYGPVLESGKDIFIQKKIGETEWSEPIRLGPEVNSNSDEDFPFFDEEKGVLYFSSTGHNSIGGYDIFKVDFDLSKNSASNRENLKFPFCSPNDDLFFVPDLQTNNAYFASNRNGQLGKVEVFLIELSEKPVQLSFISGKLTDQIDTLNKSVQINILSESSNERFGPFYSDEDGNYLIAVPKAGTYKFQVNVSGTLKEFSELVEIPKINGNKKVNQEIIYSMNNSKEKIDIITRIIDQDNLSSKLELKKYKEMAKLEVNASTLKTESKSSNRNELNDLGYTDLDSVKAFNQLFDDILDIQLDIEKNIKYEDELISQLDLNHLQLEDLNSDVIELNKKIISSTDTQEKYNLEIERRNLEKQIQTIQKQNFVILKEIEAINGNKLISRENLKEIKLISENLNEKILNSSYVEANDIISKNKVFLSQILDNRLEDKENLEKNKERKSTELKLSLEAKIAAQDTQIEKLKNQITLSESQLQKEKNKKEQERLQNELKALNSNLKIAKELNSQNQFDLTKLEKEQDAYTENKDFLSKIDSKAEDKISFQAEKTSSQNIVQSDEILNEIIENENRLSSSMEGKYEQDIAKINRISNESDRILKLKEREAQYLAELKKKLYSTENETDKEILSERIQLSQSRLTELDEYISQRLTQNGNSLNGSNNSNPNELAKNENSTQNTKENENSTKGTNNASTNEVVKNENSTQNASANENSTNGSNNSSTNEVVKNENSTQNANVNENSTKGTNYSSTNEVVKNENSTQNASANENSTNGSNNSSTNEVVKNENSTQNANVNENSTNGSNNSSTNEVVKNENSTQNANVNENSTNGSNNSSTNEVVKNENSTQNTNANENSTNGSNNSSTNEVVKNENSTQNANANENSTNGSNNSNPNELAKNENSTQNTKENENSTKGTNNASTNEVVKNENSTQNASANENSTNGSNNSSTNEVVKNENSTQNANVNENSTNGSNNSSTNELAKNEESTQNANANENSKNGSNNSSTNEVVKNENSTQNATANENSKNKNDKDSQSFLYNLNATAIEKQIAFKKNELMKTNSENDKKQIQNQISELNSEAERNLKRSFENQKRSRFNQEFPEVNIISNSDLIAEINEIKMKERSIQNKITITSNDQEKKLLKEEKNQLANLRKELEKNMNGTNLKSEFNYKIPSKANNLSDGEVEILRQNENYLVYIKEREKYNNLTKEFELALVENRILKEKINKIIIESQSIELNSELNNLGNQLIENEQDIKTKQNQLNDQFDKLSSIENSSQFEWLLANGKQPSTFLASRDNTNRIQTNFTIGKTPSVSIDKPLPVNLNSPFGLIYRVQVGAYRKPIPKEAFRDFSPVSGETLTNGLTCYMAGYFNSAQNAINARKQIRALGYTDAFIVAYCDGKRLTFAKGRELEISGQCKALSENELILALNQTVSNDEKNNNETQIQTTNSITQDYLNIPNIKEAEYGENSQHLFFTVQVGVFNKPITNNQLKQFDDLVTFKTENGQFRYSSGMFENVNDAKNHKIQANVNGVPDAYVVAYYNGKRISIAEANNLIAINGTDILKKSSPVVNSEITNNIISKDNFVELNIELPVVTNLVNSDSLIQFSLDCNTEEVIPNLEKLNRIGIFSYQQEYGRIISSKMKKAEVTNVHNEYFKDFETKIQQVDSTKIIELDVSNKLSEGSFTDWLLRSYLNHRFESNEEQKKLNIYLENDFQRNEIKRKAEELKISILNE